MNILKGLKAAAKAYNSSASGVQKSGSESFKVAGKLIECAHCENTLFHKNKFSLNTAVSSATNTEWSDKEASVLMCANCSRLEWFYDDLDAEETT